MEIVAEDKELYENQVRLEYAEPGGWYAPGFSFKSLWTFTRLIQKEGYHCTPPCTIAFLLQSDSVIQGNGVAIRDMGLYTLIPATDAYKIYNGTSLAAPMVAGTAALMWSISPDNT